MNAPVPLLAKIDRCVACGMCLAACPTYRLSRSESDSPRGRIALMRGLMRGDLRPSSVTTHHLDDCLGCRTCESICPAGVPYGDLMDETRAHIPLEQQRPLATRWLTRAVRIFVGTGPGFFRLADRLARALRRMAPLAHRQLGIPDPNQTQHANIPATSEIFEPLSAHRGDVGLFLGCIARLTDSPTLQDSIAALRRYGYRVHVPSGQRCCGALHWHEGDRRGAARLARRNLSAFADLPIEQIVSTSTACTTMLRDYGRYFADVSNAEQFAKRTVDIVDLLAEQSPVNLEPVTLHIAVHRPCTALTADSRSDTAIALLRQIPGVSVTTLPEDIGCCGAGGIHQLLRRANAKAIRETTLRAIGAIDPDVVVTTNVGCAMHLRAGLANENARCDVRHPVSLIAQQLSSRL